MTTQRDEELYGHLNKHPAFANLAYKEEFIKFFEILEKTQEELFDVLDMSVEELTKLSATSGKYEKFIMVDEDDKELFDKKGLPLIAYRKNCHIAENKERFIHRASGYIVESHDGRIYLSFRADDKDTYPSYWEIGWGHCGLNSYEEALDAEIEEELGVEQDQIESKEHVLKFLLKDKTQSQYSNYTAVTLKEWVVPEIDGEELKDLKLFSLEELYQAIEDGMKIMPHQKYVLLKHMKTKGIDTDELAEKVKLEIEGEGIYISRETSADTD